MRLLRHFPSLLALVSVYLFVPAHLHASCGDRPGTPIHLTANLANGLSRLVVLQWENRASEKVWWDFEVLDGLMRPVDTPRAGIGRGDQGRGMRIQNSFSMPDNSTRCYRVRARTEPGTEGCVSGAWSNQACVTSGNGGPLASGPDTCKLGFVWREAQPADHVCVPGRSRDEARRDNSLAGSNRMPNGGAYGPDTCKPGLVWREAFAGDHVCVTPQKRTDTRNENAAAVMNRVRP